MTKHRGRKPSPNRATSSQRSPRMSDSPLPLPMVLKVTQGGEAYVDLSRELMTAHPGGTLNELLTIYTIVNALTVNMPAVTSVQVLVDGKEVETLAGHIDLRQPLAKSLSWIQ